MKKVFNQILELTRLLYSKQNDDLKEKEVKTFKYVELVEMIKQNFLIDYYGDHGIYHWERVYINTQKLSSYYKVESEVFELFSLLHDSKRVNEFKDKHHGKNAAEFTKKLLNEGIIKLNDEDAEKLIYACANHTYSDKNNPLFNDIVVQICFDSDRLDIGRVGYAVDEKYLATDYAKSLVE